MSMPLAFLRRIGCGLGGVEMRKPREGPLDTWPPILTNGSHIRPDPVDLVANAAAWLMKLLPSKYASVKVHIWHNFWMNTDN